MFNILRLFIFIWATNLPLNIIDVDDYIMVYMEYYKSSIYIILGVIINTNNK